MKASRQQSLLSLNRVKQQGTEPQILDEREIRLKINGVNKIRIGEFSQISLDERAHFSSIIAIDVSTVKVGISNLGEVYAVRGATVIKKSDSLTINRTRPMIVLGEISDTQVSFELEEQLKNINSAKDSMILLDGSLSEITSVNKSFSLIDTLKKSSNIVISVSKGFLFPSIRLPEEIEESSFVGSILNGRSSGEYLVRLSLGGPLLKIEIYPSIELDDVVKVLASLISLDGVEYGYPETLRIAHIYSKILPVEALTLKCIMQKKFGIEVLREVDNRKMLLGGFWS
ncbi:MAG: hypothetical protein QXN75_06200 [Thermoproteota archaeon]|nr:hypothetical protein [Candidatus Brockarchaeota archaeon]